MRKVCIVKSVGSCLPASALMFLCLLGDVQQTSCAEGLEAEQPKTDQSRTAQPSNTMLKGGVGANVVLSEDVQAELGLKCSDRNGEGALVEQVAQNSPAYRVGVREGDVILDARVDANVANLRIGRNGRAFNLQVARATQLPPVAPALSPMIPRYDEHNNGFNFHANQLAGMAKQRDDGPLTGVVTVNQAKLLASYHIELIVDRSNSMMRADCPGGMTRWDWCGRQSTDLARALAPYVPDGLTITTFASDHEVFPHSSPDKIVSIFAQPNFQGGTRLYEALTDRLTDYFAQRKPGVKPLLIVVITDGVPAPMIEPRMVRDELVKVTKWMMDPREITVAFLQIGQRDLRGQAFLQDLDSNLVTTYGAKYDIVHTKLFDTLQQTGLGQALVSSVQESLSGNKPALTPISIPEIRRNNHMRRMGQMFPY